METVEDPAAGARGIDYLARADSTTELMVDAGALAPYMNRAYHAIRLHLVRTLIWNRTHSKAEALGRHIIYTRSSASERCDEEIAGYPAKFSMMRHHGLSLKYPREKMRSQ